MRFNEVKKKMSAKDDPCWSGYHMVGTKMKDGREVPNCVPGKKGVSELAAKARHKMEVLDEISDDLKEDYDKNHGSPYDRGSADKYYGRPAEPHKGGVGGGSGPRSTDLTREEIAAYMAGYREETGRKQWESVEETEALGLMSKTSRTGTKQTNPYIAMLLYKLQNDKPISRREIQDLEDHLKKIGARPKEGAPTEAMKISDIPAAMRRRLTMKDIEDEQPKGAYRYRVHHGKPEHERPRDFMSKSAADEYARAVKGRVEDLGEGEIEEIDRRGFLKGMGAAAVAGAAGGANAQWVKEPDYKDPMDDIVYRNWSNRSTNGLATLQFNQNAKQLHLKHNSGRWLPQSQWPNGRIRVDNNPPIEVAFLLTNIPNIVLLSVPGPSNTETIVNYVLSAKNRILIDVTSLTRSDQLILSFDINSTKESLDQGVAEGEVDERKLTAHELERREEIVKGMKKSKADFEKRYGDRAKSVMYATATKIAKNKDINESRRLAADEGHYYCEAEREVKQIPEGYVKV